MTSDGEDMDKDYPASENPFNPAVPGIAAMPGTAEDPAFNMQPGFNVQPDAQIISGTSPNPTLNPDIFNKDSAGQSSVVVARGTGEGLILRLDGRVDRNILINSVLEYVESRKSFFSGQEVTLEWLEARPGEGVVSEISTALQSRFQLLVKSSRMFERAARTAHNRNLADSMRQGFTGSDIPSQQKSPSQQRPVIRPTAVGNKFSSSQEIEFDAINVRAPLSAGSSSVGVPGFSDQRSASLFDGVAAVGNYSGSAGLQSSTALNPYSASTSQGFSVIQGYSSMQGYNVPDKGLISESLLWDEADTRIIKETLRGGQKIESEHSVVIIGDVNSGADIVAGGDIYVLGRLRGVAHAGAYDENGGGRRIFALQMQPTQLRIGSIISQGSDEGGRVPEIAKIEGNMIVVEPYGVGAGSRKLGRN